MDLNTAEVNKNQPTIPEKEKEEVLPVPEPRPAELESVQEKPSEPESTEVAEKNGQVFQMPEHDDPGDTAEAQARRIAPLPAEEKLWQLKLMARDQGLGKAIAAVKKIGDPWLEDKFHDDLMDDPELRQQLESLGKLEKL